MCDWVTLLYSRKLSEHGKPAIMEKIKTIKMKKTKEKKKKRTVAEPPISMSIGWLLILAVVASIDIYLKAVFILLM